MAKFSQAVVRKLENGYVVSVTTLELTERGYSPVEVHHIASDVATVIKFLGLDSESSNVVTLQSV